MPTKIVHKGLALAILAFAQFMVVLDATITNVALPAIKESLGYTSDASLQWVITAYALTFGGFLLLGGRLADLFGRRRLFIAGVTVFALASLAAGFAQTPVQMIIFRGAQGLGGAMLSPAALSLVLTIFSKPQERARALGVWSMVAAGGGAVGLVVGGVITQYIDWRWIFLINIPIAIAVIAAALRFILSTKPTSRTSVDIVGAFSITASLVALVYALAHAAENGWTDAGTVVSFVAAAMLMIGFIINERRVTSPLIHFGVIAKRNVIGANLIMLLMPAAMFGFFFYMSIYLQQILGYSPTHAGVANLPFTLTIFVIAGTISRFADKLNPRIILSIAPLVTVAGLLYFARVPVDAQYWRDIFPGILLMASGMASVFVMGTMSATQGVAAHESGFVSGLLNTMQQIGGAIGLAVLTVVSTGTTKTAIEALGRMPSPAELTDALVTGFHNGFAVAAGFAVLASIVAITVFKTHNPTKREMQQQAQDEAESFAAIPGS